MCGEEQRRRAEKEEEPSELGVLSKKSAGEVLFIGCKEIWKEAGFRWAANYRILLGLDVLGLVYLMTHIFMCLILNARLKLYFFNFY
jgi:hypothetical protein